MLSEKSLTLCYAIGPRLLATFLPFIHVKIDCRQTITSLSLKFDLSFKEQKRVRQVFKFKKGNFDYLQESLTQVPFDCAYADHKNEHLFKLEALVFNSSETSYTGKNSSDY